MVSNDQILLFFSLFKGRNDIYAKRWEKDGRNGYSPAYEVDWTEYRTMNYPAAELRGIIPDLQR